MDQQQPEVQNPFTDVPYIPLPVPVTQDKQFLSDVAEFQAGSGSTKVMRANKQGLWLGAKQFSGAPFSVDMQGNVIANSITLSGYIATGGAAADVNGNATTISGGKITANSITASQITAGTITGTEISSSTSITAGTGNDVGVMSGSDGTYRFWSGNATAASANFRVDKSGNLTANSYSLNSGNITNVSNGMVCKNTFGINYYNSANNSVIASLTVDASNVFSVYNSSGVVELRASSYAKLVSNNNECLRAQTDGSVLVATISGSGGTINMSDNVHIASTKNLVFDGTQGSINCGNIDCDTIEMNNNALGNASLVQFQARSTSWTPGDREFGSEDNGTNQRLRMKFQNNGTQWQVSLSAVCTPVKLKDVDPTYSAKYDLMDNMNESRFGLLYPKTKEVQKEYQGRPVSHFPSMGDPDGSAWSKHMEAIWKRPWIPMKKLPDRMETMGQFPYAPVHSPLIGEGESMANMYQLLAHAYNQLQDRCDKLELALKGVKNGNV